MTLYEYLNLMKEGEELTVWDKDYDMETYFYNDRPDDKDDNWSRSAWELSKKLMISINKLKEADLFVDCDVELIMKDMQDILSGNVSKEWMIKFVAALE